MRRLDRISSAALKRLIVAVIILLLVVSLGTLGFEIIEGWSVMNSFYMTLITISTLGMKDGLEISPAGKVWIIILIIVGISAAMVALSTLVGVVVEGHMLQILGRRKVDIKISSLSGHIIVCGYGRMGQALCDYLRQRKARIVVIDMAAETTLQAEQNGFLYLLGNASEEQVLHDAGIDRAASLVTVLPNDAENVFVALVARGLNSKLFISARAEKLESESRLIRAGADKVICPQVIGAKRLSNILTRPAVVDFIDFAAEVLNLEAEQYHVAKNNKLVGMSLRQANLPREVGVLIVALKRKDGQTLFNPGPDTTLAADDVMIVTGSSGSMAKLEQKYS